MYFKRCFAVLFLASVFLFTGCIRHAPDIESNPVGKLDLALLKRITADPDLAKFATVTDTAYIRQFKATQMDSTGRISAEAVRREYAPYQLAMQYALKLQERYKLTNTMAYIKVAALRYLAENGSLYQKVRALVAKNRQTGTALRTVSGAIAGFIYDPITGGVYVTDNPDYSGFYVFNGVGMVEAGDEPVYQTLAEVFVTGIRSCEALVKMKLMTIARMYPSGMQLYIAGASDQNLCYSCIPSINIQSLRYNPDALDLLYSAVKNSFMFADDDCGPWIGIFETEIMSLDAQSNFQTYGSYIPSGGFYGWGGGGNPGNGNPGGDVGDDPLTIPTAVIVEQPPSDDALAALGSSWGLAFPEKVDIVMGAARSNGAWRSILKEVRGYYSVQARLISGVSEVNNTSVVNFCEQVRDLQLLGNHAGVKWYMIAAVQAHENVHVSRMQGTLYSVLESILNDVNTLAVPDNGQTRDAAIAELQNLPGFQEMANKAIRNWTNKVFFYGDDDHASGGPCEQAEHAIVDPVWNNICNTAKSQVPAWPVCTWCP